MLKFRKTSGLLRLYTEGHWNPDDLDLNDMGFLPRYDRRGCEIDATLHLIPEWQWLNKLQISAGGMQDWNPPYT